MAAGLSDLRFETGDPDHRCSVDPVHGPVCWSWPTCHFPVIRACSGDPETSYTRSSQGEIISMRGCSPLEKIVQMIVPLAAVSRTATARTSCGGPRRRLPRRFRGTVHNASRTSCTTNVAKQSTNAVYGETGAPVGKSSYTWKAGERNATRSPTTGVSIGAITSNGAPV